MEQHQQHSSDTQKAKDLVASLIDELQRQRTLSDHALHQLFELRPSLGVEVSEEQADKGLQVVQFKDEAGPWATDRLVTIIMGLCSYTRLRQGYVCT